MDINHKNNGPDHHIFPHKTNNLFNRIRKTFREAKLEPKTFTNYWSIQNPMILMELNIPGYFLMTPVFGEPDYEFTQIFLPGVNNDEGFVDTGLYINKYPGNSIRLQYEFTAEHGEASEIINSGQFVHFQESPACALMCRFTIEALTNENNHYLTFGCKITVFEKKLGENVFDGQHSLMKMEHEFQKAGLIELFNTGQLADFTLISSCGHEFPTHMCILHAQSKFFKKLLGNKNSHEFKEKKMKLDFPAQTLALVLRHIYSESLVLEEEHLTMGLILAVNKLKITSLQKKIGSMLWPLFPEEEMVSRLLIASGFELDELYQSLIQHFASKKDEIIVSEQWANLREINPQLSLKVLEDVSNV